MKMNMKRLGWLFSCCLLLLSQTVFCEVRLPALISDGMVLQREANTKIWGWADEGEKVTIGFNGKTYHTSAGSDGKWEVVLSQMKTGGPFTMSIEANNRITLKDIMIGDVWVCSGQSNMELSMERVKYRYPDVIANSDNPAIRQFVVPDAYNFKQPQEDLKSGHWVSANPESILEFTAVGFFFAKDLFEKYSVPIGLINTSLGGSPAQAWLSEEALRDFPEYLETAIKYKNDDFIEQIIERDNAIHDEWYNRLQQTDEGLHEGKLPWFNNAYDSSEWATMDIPGYWADHDELGPLNGVVWFRKEIHVSDSMTSKPAKIWLGRIVDADTTYVNGEVVGSVSYKYPPRIYDIPSNLLKPGLNIITIRVINNAGRGGFFLDKPYELSTKEETINLKGPWQYKLGAVMEPLPDKTYIQWKPLGLYNAMIAPLLNYRIKGVIWYQGESNADKPHEYHELFSALIADWRMKWCQEAFPFLYVQLANFMESRNVPGESDWAELREAQLQTLFTPNTAMAVTIDIGEWNDIHPLNKEDVGKRLALAAQKLAYGEDIVYSGPIYKSMKIDGNKIILSFTNTGSGLSTQGSDELKHFAIAGIDKKFIWAKAKIEGHKVIVWNDHITNPVAVRYGWADNPEGANLYNKEGLPASPFRTEITESE